MQTDRNVGVRMRRLAAGATVCLCALARHLEAAEGGAPAGTLAAAEARVSEPEPVLPVDSASYESEPDPRLTGITESELICLIEAETQDLFLGATGPIEIEFPEGRIALSTELERGRVQALLSRQALEGTPWSERGRARVKLEGVLVVSDGSPRITTGQMTLGGMKVDPEDLRRIVRKGSKLLGED